ncbi:MAG: SurA N-terminal domain-containing protein, partial [Deltaproteobacteria bacterium]|nr:SurA N-terminal domain-containing protein [Deltaproteobacteria bacterium]
MSDVVATVNGVPIDQKALGAAVHALAQEQFHCPVAELPEGSHDELKQMAIERLIARELIYQAALAEGFIASQEDVAAETSRILRLSGQPKNFWSRLAERGMDQIAFERMVRKDVTVDQITACKTADVATPDEQSIENFFREDPHRLQKPQRVRLQHILFPVDPENPDEAFDRAKAVKLKSEKTDFRVLAQKYSACPSAPGGGDLGYVRQEDIDSALADV